jgi:hypothetical protein
MTTIRLGQVDYSRPLSAVWVPDKPHYFIASERAARGYERISDACTAAAGIADLLRPHDDTPALRSRLAYWAGVVDGSTRSGPCWARSVASAQDLTSTRLALRAALQTTLEGYTGRTPKERSELALIKSWVVALRGPDTQLQRQLYAAAPERLRRLCPQ